MEISRTLKVGALAIISIGVLIWGYTYLKGQNIFQNSTQIYVEYDNIDGLSISAPVKVNGFKIGVVSQVYLKEDYSGKIMVVLDISEPLSIDKEGVDLWDPKDIGELEYDDSFDLTKATNQNRLKQICVDLRLQSSIVLDSKVEC